MIQKHGKVFSYKQCIIILEKRRQMNECNKRIYGEFGVPQKPSGR